MTLLDLALAAVVVGAALRIIAFVLDVIGGKYTQGD